MDVKRGRLFKRTAQKSSKASCRLSCLLAKGQLEAFCPSYQTDIYRGPTCQNQSASVGKPLQRQAISKLKGSGKRVELVGSDFATPAVSSASSVSSKAAAAVQVNHAARTLPATTLRPRESEPCHPCRPAHKPTNALQIHGATARRGFEHEPNP